MTERDIFIAALHERNPAERAAFLGRVCGEDRALRDRVEALLQEEEQLGSFLERPAEPMLGTGLFTPAPENDDHPHPGEEPGMVIGPYRLLQLIGEGGMGAVWMADQLHPVQRMVALKIIKAGMDSRQVLARFEAERQALALMDHPNIAKVHDGGSTVAGRPYFVMELVKGQPITRYCDEHRLTPRQRLELFVPVCQAIQHAHTKGIIHRDVKPSNVLIAPYDGKPVVKVIDFGIAKATGQRLTEKTLFTEFGAVVGTLEYMSPEQAELNNQDIDTRSDVYSLGVLLYELLTGTTPLDRSRLKQVGFMEVLRWIREEEPPTPSTRLSTTDQLPAIAANRGLEPRKLSGLVRGELDWVVMKALDKDRNRRYETATAFAADVLRYLHDEPVSACPPSAWYRFRKFARRNRAALSAGGLISAALVATVAILAFSTARVTREKQQKEAALQRAQENLTDALGVVDQLLTRAADERLAHIPHVEPVRRDLLGDALKYYQQFLRKNRDDPTVRLQTGKAYLRLGDIHHLLGESDQAKAAYTQGIALLEQLAAEQPSLADCRQILAYCHAGLAQALMAVGSPREAEQAARRALTLQEKLVADAPAHAGYRQGLAYNRHLLALLCRNTGRRAEAEQGYRAAITLLDQLALEFPAKPDYRKDLAGYCVNLATLLGQTDKLEEAERFLRKAVRTAVKVAPEVPRERGYQNVVAMTRTQLANLLMNTGRFDEAEREYRKALEPQKKLVDDFPSRPDFRNLYAANLGYLGILYRRTNRRDDARKMWDQARKLHEKLAGEYPQIAGYQSSFGASLSNWAFLLEDEGKLDEARATLEQAIRRQLIALKANPREPTAREFLGKHYQNLAHILGQLRAPEEEKVRRQAIEVQKRLAADFPNVLDYQSGAGITLSSWAERLRARGQLEKARRLLGEAIRYQWVALKANPDNPGYFRLLCSHYARRLEIIRALGKDAEAEEAEQQLLAVLNRLPRPQFARARSELGGNLNDMAQVLRGRGKFAEAHRLLLRAIDHQKAALASAPRHPTYLLFLHRHYWQLGQVLKEMGKNAGLEEAYRLNIAVLEKVVVHSPGEARHPSDLAVKQNDLAALLLDQGRDPEEALQLLERAVRHQRAALERKADVEDWRCFLGKHYWNLARALTQLKRYPEAEQAHRDCLSVREKLAADFPTDNAYLQDLAATYGKLTDLLGGAMHAVEREKLWGKAKTVWRQLVVRRPKNALSHYGLATTLHNRAVELGQRGDLATARTLFQEAIKHQRRAADLAPKEPGHRKMLVAHHDNLIITLQGLKDHAAVAQAAEDLARLEPQSWRAYYRAFQTVLRALFAAEKDDRLSAEKRKALLAELSARADRLLYETAKLSPDEAAAQAVAAWFLLTAPKPRFRDPKRAVELAEKAVQQEPIPGRYQIIVALAHYRTGNAKKAVAVLNDPMQQKRNGPKEWFVLAMAHWQLGNKDEARIWYDRAVRRLEQEPPALGDLRGLQVEAARLFATP
jgi:serine/threonine protein kinase/tetratricopeptide (TPR) repeat protein